MQELRRVLFLLRSQMVEILEAEMKNLTITILFLSCLGLTFWCVRLYRNSIMPKPAELPSIIDIQEAVGAKPDGIVGPETIGLWEIAYANQEAAKFMTPSGAPRKDK